MAVTDVSLDMARQAAGDAAGQAVQSKLSGVGNLKMGDYGITPDEFPKMVQNTRDAMGFLLGFDPVALSEEDMLNIYQKSYR